MFKEFSLTAFLCIKKILSRFYGTTKRNAQHHEGSLWRSWGMNSDLHVSVQYLDYVIISTAHLKFIWWSWTSVSNCIFHLFLSTLLIAWGTGGEWSFYTLGVFFNTVLLSPFFASLLRSQVVWNQVSSPFYIWNAVFCIHAHTCHQKFNLCPPF